MKIIHYSLGFPPERTGGLVQYVFNLAKEQLNLGHDVTIMYPGKISFFRKQISLKVIERNNIRSVELVNSLPLPLIGNIGNPADFMLPSNRIIFEKFLRKENPDVIHVHTLMGLYAEFISVAKQLNIKLVFTTHDYFGISPNPKFYLGGHDFAEDDKHDIWNYVSNEGSPTIRHKLLQTRIYPQTRSILKKIRPNKFLNLRNPIDYVASAGMLKENTGYLLLRNYYLNMLKSFDVLHFNSYVSMRVYGKYLKLKNFDFEVLHVTSRNIEQVKVSRKKLKKIKTIAFIGPYTVEKGFDQFLKFASEHYNMYTFVAMGDNRKIPDKYTVKNLGKFNSSELNQFIADVDLVIIPSVWHETFGLVGLESLSRNIKTISSNKTGFSDLLSNDFIFNDLADVNIYDIENAELTVPKIDNMAQHTVKIINMYKIRKS
ncbi:glycosyl transferase, group 1 [Leuconostoc inhae]|uniref:Glycosyl transferase, group 1 n=2 Tax=Lactobacillaceae TaxID=33958 RepID=A0AAN2QU04_9LACO|nr:glycosyl transferase, group 1 [Leuconostoc inhae]CUW07860.1 glycosyl transferase, group 1 [Leuconostoc inhae]